MDSSDVGALSEGAAWERCEERGGGVAAWARRALAGRVP